MPRFTWTRSAQVATAAAAVLGVVAISPWSVGFAQSGEYSLLEGAIDLHLHIDPDTPTGNVDSIDMAGFALAHARGIRGFVIKNHKETTASVAYLVRKANPGIEAFGSIALNLIQGGINLSAVEYMATGIRGRPFRVVWMPTYDAEHWVRRSANPDGPAVKVSENGELLPVVKQMIGLIAKHGLVLATGHSSPEEHLMLVREGRRQGVGHIIVTHPMISSVSMNEAQLMEAKKLGAFLEFDYRNILVEEEKLEMIKRLGPESVIIDEFWSKSGVDREYGGPEELATWVKVMNSQGFSNADLDRMVKENPAKILGLPYP
jgi:hypothetical protein